MQLIFLFINGEACWYIDATDTEGYDTLHDMLWAARDAGDLACLRWVVPSLNVAMEMP